MLNKLLACSLLNIYHLLKFKSMPNCVYPWFKNIEYTYKMNNPSRKEAESLLAEAALMNPGPWVSHSRNVALAARLIAGHHPRLDPDAAYILGLLHDIGRREGVTYIRHLIDGYNFLNDLGYADAARVCLTHSFPIPDLYVYMGDRDCTVEELKFLEDFLATVEFDEYDRLIQLCDGIAQPTGFLSHGETHR